MRAFLKNYRQSPRKARLVADMVRGKEVEQARAMLQFTDNKSAPVFLKLIESAVANARQVGFSGKDLIVKRVMVDEGLSMTRYMPRARGRATPYEKRTSRITIILEERSKDQESSKRPVKKEVAAKKSVVGSKSKKDDLKVPEVEAKAKK